MGDEMCFGYLQVVFQVFLTMSMYIKAICVLCVGDATM
ncbi:MAG: hypothetical protein H6Q20_1212 [Bacteroidetes bacterium]|nr:hypothetical protein [Bacteroidota bacterium]